jgi:hypothetical protein
MPSAVISSHRWDMARVADCESRPTVLDMGLLVMVLDLGIILSRFRGAEKRDAYSSSL